MFVRHYLFLALVLGTLTVIGQTSAIHKSYLVKCWTDSREENIQGSETTIYRPCDFKDFPPSRFRFSMELNEDGTCTYMHLASNDAHHMTAGSWTYNDLTKSLEIVGPKGNLIRKFKILILQKDVMEIVKD